MLCHCANWGDCWVVRIKCAVYERKRSSHLNMIKMTDGLLSSFIHSQARQGMILFVSALVVACAATGMDEVATLRTQVAELQAEITHLRASVPETATGRELLGTGRSLRPKPTPKPTAKPTAQFDWTKCKSEVRFFLPPQH